MQVPDIENHYRKNFNRIVKRMSFRAGSTAGGEDVVQTAYEWALRYKASCIDGRFEQWFSMLLTNSLRRYKNEENGYTAIYDDDEETSSDLDCPHLPQAIIREVQELIKTKSLVQIEVLELYFNNEYKAKDIAKVTEHSYVAIRKIISRFRQELKELYGN